jgi:hypothetical protein
MRSIDRDRLDHEAFLILFLYSTAMSIMWTSCVEPDNLGVASLPEDCYAVPKEKVDWIGRACDYRGELAATATGACTLGEFVCDRGILVCRGAVLPEARDLCVGVDADCDGDVQLDTTGGVELCYFGPPETLLHPATSPCRPGVFQCAQTGELECLGQVLPLPEIPDNCIDDDCDGTVDLGAAAEVNVVVLLDTSGSMTEFYPEIGAALTALVEDPRVRLWLIDVPTIGGGPDASGVGFWYSPVCHPGVVLASGPLASPVAPCAPDVLRAYLRGLVPYGGGVEPLYGALQYVGLSGSTDMALVDGPRVVLLFADEDPLDPANLGAETTGRLVRIFSESPWAVNVFTHPEFYPRYPFARRFPLSSPPDRMTGDVASTVENACPGL